MAISSVINWFYSSLPHREPTLPALEDILKKNTCTPFEELSSLLDPSKTDSCGNTQLHLAINYQRTDLVKELLARGANPNLRNSEGLSCLTLAAMTNKVSILEALLEHQDLDLKEEGYTALMETVYQGNEATLRTLLSYFSQFKTQKWEEGFNAYARAIRLGHTHLLPLLEHEAATGNQLIQVRQCANFNGLPRSLIIEEHKIQTEENLDTLALKTYQEALEEHPVLKGAPLHKERITALKLATLHPMGKTNPSGIQDLVHHIQEGRLTFIPTGCYGHSMYVVIKENLLAIANSQNKYDHPILEFYEIDPTKITYFLLLTLLHLRHVEKEKSLSFLYNTLPKILSRNQKVQNCTCKFEAFQVKLGTSNTCTAQSLKAAMYAAFAIEGISFKETQKTLNTESLILRAETLRKCVQTFAPNTSLTREKWEKNTLKEKTDYIKDLYLPKETCMFLIDALKKTRTF